MANVLKEQKIIDTTKRSLLKYVFICDGTADANSLIVNVSQLAYSLNANNYIMSSDTDQKSSYRTTIKRIFGMAKANGYVSLLWNGIGTTGNTEIVTFSDGNFDYSFESMGDVASIPNPNVSSSNCNGDILYTTSNMKSGDAFTLFIDLKKDARDYDSGQTADPTAFNRGPAAGL